MRKRFFILAAVLLAGLAGYGYRVKTVNEGYPKVLEQVRREFPYTYEKLGCKVTLTGYDVVKAEDEDYPHYEVRIHVSIEAGEEVPQRVGNLFPIALAADGTIQDAIQGGDIAGLSPDETNQDIKRIRPNTVTEGYVYFNADLDGMKPWALDITPRAFPEKYDLKWREGKLYFEYIPLEVTNAEA